MHDVVIVGGSLAGLRAAETLRQEGFAGSVVIVEAEDRAPYDRPPLSKQVLAGTWEPDHVKLPVDVDGLDVDWERGRRATALDLGGRQVHLDDGRALAFDGLVLATGATPRHLPGGAELVGVHVLRTADDALALRADLDAGPSWWPWWAWASSAPRWRRPVGSGGSRSPSSRPSPCRWSGSSAPTWGR